MGHTLLWVLGVFSLNILLYCGHAQDAVLTIEPNWSTLFTGESVTFICDMREDKDATWFYAIANNGLYISYGTNQNYTLQPLATDHSNEYQCLGEHSGYKKGSNEVSLTVSDKDVILETPASTLFEGESVTLRCRHRNQTNEMKAVFYKDGSPIEKDTKHQSQISKNTVQILSDGSSYMCKFDDEESEQIKLKMEPQPKAQLSKDVMAGGNMILTCFVNSSSSSSGWKYFWYRDEKTSEPLTSQDDVFLSSAKIRVSQGGLYMCRGGRGEPVYYTEFSDSVGTVTNRAVVTMRPMWPEIYSGETITLTCEIKDGGDTEWDYEWIPSSYTSQKQNEYMIRDARSSHSGVYRCMGRKKGEKASTGWSDAIKVKVFDKPHPVLTVSPLWLSPGASVTLNCSVKHPSAGWRIYWYKAVPDLSYYPSYSYELLPGSSNGTEQDSYIVHGQTHTAGYVCRAGRGDPVYYIYNSSPKFVWSEGFHPAASLTVSPDRVQHFTKESFSLSCRGNSTAWTVKQFDYSLSHCSSLGRMNGSTCIIDRYWFSGVYWCESETGQFSNAVNITIQHNDIILVSPVHPVAEGDSVTLGCKSRTENVLHNVNFYKNGKLIQKDTTGEMTIPAVSKSDEGFYKCEGRESPKEGRSWTSHESWMSVKGIEQRHEQSYVPSTTPSKRLFNELSIAEAFQNETGQDALLTIEPNWSTLFTGESVTFICDMREDKDAIWYYAIANNGLYISYDTNQNYTLQPLATDHSNEYQCLGEHRGYKKGSNEVSLTVSDKDVILETPASTLFEGESVTLRCRHRNQTNEMKAVFYKDGSPIEKDTKHQSQISKNTVQILSDGSSYMCKFDDEESDQIKLKMEPQPKAQLSKDVKAGGNMILTCFVNSSSSGWKYFWYRDEKTSEPLTAQDDVFLSSAKIRVSQGGLYMCRGGRGEPVYYTEFSDSVGTVTNRAVVTQRPMWPEIYSGETITLTCEIEDGGDTEWEYEWIPSSYTSQKQNEYSIKDARSSHSGVYRCMGRKKGEKASTGWSDAIKVKVFEKPHPVLTVSPLWLSPGASVTLNCSVKHPSAGWRIYWYKAVPKVSDYPSYSYELLPGSSNGTEQDSYIVHGQTHTAGYVCRAGRGDPVYYTYNSSPKFVWSEGFQPAASLTVSPNRVQHFTKESFSLSCRGNSTAWTVKQFDYTLSHCSSLGTMTGSTCIIDRYLFSGVYWCESETGQFSNAVNITIQYNDIILVSPVNPVAEGDSVTLGCKSRTENVLHNVNFYKNGKLIQKDTRGEMTIPAVSKSDEGFYKCEGRESPQEGRSWTSHESWMSVKCIEQRHEQSYVPSTTPSKRLFNELSIAEAFQNETGQAPVHEKSSPFPVLLIVGPVCGALLIIPLLLFLYRYRKSKDSCFIRSQSTNQGLAKNHKINEDGTQMRDYSPLHLGDDCIYEIIRDPGEHQHGWNNEPEDIYDDIR